MSFNIERASDTRQVKTDISGFGDDNINISRDPFKIDPTKNTEGNDELGMDFLVDTPPPPAADEEDSDEEEDLDYEERDPFTSNFNGDSPQEPQKSYEEIQQEKSYLLSQLKRLEKKGSVLSRRFSMEHSLDEIRGEVFRIKKEESMDSAIDYCRQGLMFCVSTIEMADDNYNFGAELGGWSRNVMGNIETYDSVFEELYEKYYSTVGVSPEIKLISMLAGSAFMFSLQKKMLKGKAPPPRQREMSGPTSIDTDDLMRRLNEVDIDEDDISIVSEDSIKIKEEETKTINVKKPRGRPKNKNLS
jgi:hypothetical protein